MLNKQQLLFCLMSNSALWCFLGKTSNEFSKRITLTYIVNCPKVETKRDSQKSSNRNKKYYVQADTHKTISAFSVKPCRPEWSGIIHSIYSTERKKFHLRIPCPAKLSFRIEGEINNFTKVKGERPHKKCYSSLY